MDVTNHDDQLLRFFRRHLVALGIRCVLPDGTSRATVYSCFAIEVLERWFLVTAGHIIHSLDKSLHLCSEVQCKLFDAWFPDSHREPIPFNFENCERIAFDNDGLDVGFIVVEPIHRRMLEANGVVAFKDSTWKSPPDDINVYAVIGFPEEFIEHAARDAGTEAVEFSPVLVWARKTEPPEAIVKRFPSFYGALADQLVGPNTGDDLRSMVGLSGGPVLGVRSDEAGQVTYFLVAAQSAWHGGFRILYGPLMAKIAGELEQHLLTQVPTVGAETTTP